MTRAEELATHLFGQLEEGRWDKTTLELITDAIANAMTEGGSDTQGGRTTSRERANKAVEKIWPMIRDGGVPTAGRLHEICVDAVLEALAAPALGWTKEKPTVVGVYWWRNEMSDNEIVKVYATIHSGLRVAFMNGNRFFVADIKGEWAGPITPPPDTRENEA